MSIIKWQQRLIALIAVTAGCTITSVHAQEASGLHTVDVQAPTAAPVVTDSAPVAEIHSAPTPVADEQPVYEYPSTMEYSELSAPVTSAASCSCCKTTCCTKEKKEAATAKMKGAYKGVFYANDFSYLKDKCYDGPSFWSDSFKNMDMPIGTLSLGGETRYRYHNEDNFSTPGLGLTGNSNQFWLQRQRLYADWKLSDCLRIYGEMLHSESTGNENPPRPIDENHADMTNLFLDVKLFDGDMGKFILRVGRQELLYGAQRTVSPLDWANTRRSFEGVRGVYSNGDFSLDAFWTRPVIVSRSDADEGDENQDFFGAYATQKGTPLGVLEAYYLGYNNDNAAANFTYHTLGSRVSGKTDGGILYDFEGAMQFGDNNTVESHSAGFFTAGLGRKVDKLKTTFWGWYDYASGEEDFGDVGLGDGGYHHLFPLAHKYNGFMDLFGRRNLHDLNFQTITPLSKKVTMITWFHHFMLAEQTTPYNVVMAPFRSGAGQQAGDKELGQEIDLLFNINLNPRNNLLLGYSHFTAGDYYKTTAGVDAANDHADFFYCQFQSRF